MRRFAAVLVLLFAGAPALAQGLTDTPQEGEGIWSLLRRHGVTPSSETIAQFKDLNAARLSGSESLKEGVSYKIPVDAAEIHPIFGPGYERIERKSDRLKGHVYYVVPGHGGPDPGTIGTYAGRSIAEDEVAYDTSLRFARALLEHGATVYNIVEDDDGIRDAEVLRSDRDETFFGGVPIVLSQKKRLADQAQIINNLYDKHRGTAVVQRVISLHVDAVGSRIEPQIDVHFIYASDKGKELSRALSTTIRSKYDEFQPGRGYRGKLQSRNLMILRETKPVAVLVELGNIRNTRDQQRLMKPGNRQALANWMVEGLLKEAAKLKV